LLNSDARLKSFRVMPSIKKITDKVKIKIPKTEENK